MRSVLAFLLLGCGSAAGTPDAPGQPLPDAVSLTCDTVAQDCLSKGNVATPKCTLTQSPLGILVTRCVMRIGTKAVGESCMRFAGGPGFDDCDIGMYCSGLTLKCRKFCRDDGPCATGERCVVVGANTPQDGLCVPVCALFSTTCGEGNTCDPVLLVDRNSDTGLCRIAGTVAVGGDCTGGLCVPDAVCTSSSDGSTATCLALCDASHACPGGATCKTLPGLGDGGYCPI